MKDIRIDFNIDNIDNLIIFFKNILKSVIPLGQNLLELQPQFKNQIPEIIQQDEYSLDVIYKFYSGYIAYDTN